ncbi:2376_t:CDS:1 [Gigaspora margarita]|uniref:2376_t:CDS:1 n=1 Tax=Gigaspora margarita TaxID=4874 RepID=A0ABN7W5P3_GIGMA|nr:2376_t:CDS:1 [Gigaspora margarita]
MNQSINQIIGVQPQNNGGQLQRPRNIGGPQNPNGQFQRNSIIGMMSVRSQNTANTNTTTGVFTAVQQYADLTNGTEPFTRTQDVEDLPPQSTRFSTLLFSGVSLP